MKINFHIYETCNMNCEHCFRPKDSFKLNSNWKDAIDIIANYKEIDYINIAGGEPTLNKELLIEILDYIKSKKLKSSIITNGSIIAHDNEFLLKILEYVDCLGLSIDSLDDNINHKIKRVFSSNETLSFSDIQRISNTVKQANKKLKVNVVINKYNINDNSIEQLKLLNIDKLKILRNQLDNNITKEMCANVANKFKGDIPIINIEYDMNDSYIMLDSDLYLSTELNGQKVSIFDNDALRTVVNTLKQSTNYEEKNRNYN